MGKGRDPRESGPREPRRDPPESAQTSIAGFLSGNIRALGISRLVAGAASFLAVVAVARSLGGADFGRYTAAFSLVTLFAVAIEFGTRNYLIREGAQRPEALGGLIGQVIVIRLTLGVAMVGAAVPLGIALGLRGAAMHALVILAVGSVVSQVGFTFLGTLQALERLPEAAAVYARVGVLQAAGMAGAALAGWGLRGVAWAYLATAVAYPIEGWRRLRRHWAGRVDFRRSGYGTTFAIVGAFAVSEAMYVVLTYADSVMVAGIRGSVATGLYGAAYRVLIVIGAVATVYDESAARSMARLATSARGQMAHLYGRALSHLTMFSLPVAAGGAVLAQPIMATVYGPSYVAAAPALVLLMATMVLAACGGIVTTAANSLHMERRMAAIYLSAVVGNVVLNLAAVPAFGIVGAAATTLAAHVYIIAVPVWLLRREGLSPHWTATAVKPGIATAIMLAAVVPLRAAPLPVPILVGAAVYVGALLLLRPFEAYDRQLLRGLLQRRPAA